MGILFKTRGTEEGGTGGDTVKTERVHLFGLFYGSKMKQM